MLLSTTSAADTRNREATLMFQNIASVLDEAICENVALPQHLNKPFREFVADLNAVTRRHFESHVRGSPRPPKPYSSTQAASTLVQPTVRATGNNHTISRVPQSTSFASVAAAPAPAPAPAQNQRSRSRAPQRQPASRTPAVPLKATNPFLRKAQPVKVREDNRLLVRVAEGHPALRMSPYAVMQQINNYLTEKLVS
ncbi:hypothetical protein K3495_g3175 [Podosphaera aphanis]|nr:hypothetical protein K3495_g3175 [Podosphaera aphanis]